MSANIQQMLTFWSVMDPAMKASGLAANLVRKFKMTENEAWITAVRFLNDRRA
jgi:hypothetical protein